MALGIVPMCSYQMERMFNTTRIPGKQTGVGLFQAWAGAMKPGTLSTSGLRHSEKLLAADPRCQLWIHHANAIPLRAQSCP